MSDSNIPNSPEQTPRLSAFVICKNEESNIRRCLESLKWADEILIVDSGSTDRTLEICKEFTNKIIQRAWPGFVEQKKFSLSQCRYEWILNIDADEEVSAQLRDEIQKIIRSNGQAGAIDGYYLPRVVFYMRKWWRKGGWYPEFRLRLCRRAKTSWGGDDPHEKALVEGKTAFLSGPLHHFTYADLTQHVGSLNSLSSAAARSMFKRGIRYSPLRLLLHPIFRWVKFYVFKRGFLEGFPGFLVAILESFYVFLKYAKLWELEREDRLKNS